MQDDLIGIQSNINSIYQWMKDWLNDPETIKKLKQNISKYKQYYSTYDQEYRTEPISKNINTQIQNQNANIDWAKNTMRIYNHDKEEYKGHGVMGSYDAINNDLWISPRNINRNRQITEQMIADKEPDALELGWPTVNNLLTEEMTHAQRGYPQEVASEQIVKNSSKKYNISQDGEGYLNNGAEIYASLQRLRRITDLKPGQKINKAWIQNHINAIKSSRLGGMDPELLIQLNNEVAYNMQDNENNDLKIPYAKSGKKLIKKISECR